MSSINKFEDIEAWQKARLLSKAIYGYTRQGDFAKDFNLRDQIRRAVISIMSNIAEGFERGSNEEFIHFLYIAKVLPRRLNHSYILLWIIIILIEINLMI